MANRQPEADMNVTAVQVIYTQMMWGRLFYTATRVYHVKQDHDGHSSTMDIIQEIKNSLLQA
jgi:hypothetical protein